MTSKQIYREKNMNIIKSVQNHIKSVKCMARLADRWAKVIARHGPFPRTPFRVWREIATEKVSQLWRKRFGELTLLSSAVRCLPGRCTSLEFFKTNIQDAGRKGMRVFLGSNLGPNVDFKHLNSCKSNLSKKTAARGPGSPSSNHLLPSPATCVLD